MSESGNDEAEEAQLGRAKDCEGQTEYGQGYHGVYSGRRYGKHMGIVGYGKTDSTQVTMYSSIQLSWYEADERKIALV